METRHKGPSLALGGGRSDVRVQFPPQSPVPRWKELTRLSAATAGNRGAWRRSCGTDRSEPCCESSSRLLGKEGAAGIIPESEGEVGRGTQESISFTCVPTSRGEISSILKSGRPKRGCRRLWDRLTFRNTCGEGLAANPIFLGSIPSTSTLPNPTPQLTVQAVFKENLFCLKEMRMRVEEAGWSSH